MERESVILSSVSTKERAIAAIESLPEDSDMADILREIAFITRIDAAREEIARGEGMDSIRGERETPRMDYRGTFSPTSIHDLADSVAYISRHVTRMRPKRSAKA
jgi:hypothetical protein